MKAADAKGMFLAAWRIFAADVKEPTPEHRFHPTRRFRFDYAWPDDGVRVAVEIDGGGFVGGRHNRPLGMEKDHEKMNLAVRMGWKVLRFTPRMLKRDPGGCVETVLDAMGAFNNGD